MITITKFLLTPGTHIGMNKSGISLVEIVISMFVLAAVMLPVFYTLSSGRRSMMVTEAEFRAHSAALEIAGQITSLPFHIIPEGSFSSEEIYDSAPFGEVKFRVSENNDITFRVEIEKLTENGVDRFKKISVTAVFLPSVQHENLREFTINALVANERL